MSAAAARQICWRSGGRMGWRSMLREAWEAGVVLCGVSAGALCWFEGGSTDSFGNGLLRLQDGLGLLPGSFCPHYDGEAERRPTYPSSSRRDCRAAGQRTMARGCILWGRNCGKRSVHARMPAYTVSSVWAGKWSRRRCPRAFWAESKSLCRFSTRLSLIFRRNMRWGQTRVARRAGRGAQRERPGGAACRRQVARAVAGPVPERVRAGPVGGADGGGGAAARAGGPCGTGPDPGLAVRAVSGGSAADAADLPADIEPGIAVIPPLSNCPHCAADLPEGATECRRCGERIRLCPVCGTPNTWLARDVPAEPGPYPADRKLTGGWRRAEMRAMRWLRNGRWERIWPGAGRSRRLPRRGRPTRWNGARRWPPSAW